MWWHLGQAAIMGLVQGITEFLPISSTGHLIIAGQLLRLPDAGNLFDATLHLATLAAVLIYFRKDWWMMVIVPSSSKTKASSLAPNRRLLGWLALATIPGLVMGYFGNVWIEQHWRSLLSVGAVMIIMGVVYLLFERLVQIKKTGKLLTYWDALSIGLAQALAVIPGVSRSGATLLSGVYVGLTRAESARFSFLLSAPIIAAAGGYGLYKSLADKAVIQDYWFWLVAFVVALLSGMLAINWLLKFYQKHSLKWFAIYLLVAGAGLIVYHFFS